VINRKRSAACFVTKNQPTSICPSGRRCVRVAYKVVQGIEKYCIISTIRHSSTSPHPPTFGEREKPTGSAVRYSSTVRYSNRTANGFRHVKLAPRRPNSAIEWQGGLNDGVKSVAEIDFPFPLVLISEELLVFLADKYHTKLYSTA